MPRASSSKVSKPIHEQIRKCEFLRAGTRVGVAVSGGADSVSLLSLLFQLRGDLGVVLSVVHFNHKLRGKASEKDEEFVAALAEKFGLTLHVGRADVGTRAKRERVNLEDAARRARYAFFRRLTEGGLVDCVATAHTADDQAETVLAHILRGTGLAGLAGIHPATTDGIIRPLLHVRRSELRKYLRARKQSWREDATNRDASRQRARMRKKLLPLLEKQFNPQAVNHLGELAQLAREEEALAEAFSQDYYDVLVKRETEGIRIPVQHVLWPFSWPAGEIPNRALGKRLVRRAFAKLSAGHGQLTLPHVKQLIRLAESGENGKALQLPGGVDARRDDDALVFLLRDRSAKKNKAPIEYAHPVDLRDEETQIAVKEIGCVIRLRSIDWTSAQRQTMDKGWAALDREKLQGALTLRSLRPGDRMRPEGHRGTHKLKRLLNEMRVSRWDRDGWPVLESGKNVVWARGYVSTEFAATKGTRKAILVSEEKA